MLIERFITAKMLHQIKDTLFPTMNINKNNLRKLSIYQSLTTFFDYI